MAAVSAEGLIMTIRQAIPAFLAVPLALLGGCTYQGGDIGDALHRKFHWLSFVAGDDIKASCGLDTPDRARLVYNAVWGKQVRIYEWDSLRKSLRIRVVGPGAVNGATLDDPIAGWKADEATLSLDQAAYQELDQALAQSGGFGPAAKGLELPSTGYYWAAATCHQGSFTMTGWLYPSQTFDAATFPAKLFALDPGRDTVRKAGPDPVDPLWEYERKRGAVTDFTIRVGG
jgi:hypothetical protein